MKKFLVLLFVPLLISAVFAGNLALPQTPKPVPVVNSPLTQTAKLEFQINILEAMNYLKITPTQAASLAQSMIKFKTAVNSLENYKVKALTMLRNSLIKNDKAQLTEAKKMLETLGQKYKKVTSEFITSIKSVVTLEQAEKAKAFFERMKAMRTRRMQERKLPFLGKEKPFLKQHNPNKGQVGKREAYEKKNEIGKRAKPVQPNHQRLNKPKKLSGIEEFNLMMRKTNFIYFIVNSKFYDMLINTLELKAK